jgi:hypothetical protein
MESKEGFPSLFASENGINSFPAFRNTKGKSKFLITISIYFTISFNLSSKSFQKHLSKFLDSGRTQR